MKKLAKKSIQVKDKDVGRKFVTDGIVKIRYCDF